MMTLWVRKRRSGDHWRNVSARIPVVALPKPLTDYFLWKLATDHGLVGKGETVGMAWIVPPEGD
jgi:hypothetical protein